MADAATTLEDVLDRMDGGADGDRVPLGQLFDAVGGRAHGPLLVLPALLALLPTGAIPGMSIATGTLILLVAGQMALSRDQLWLPPRLARVDIGAGLLHRAVRRGRPMARALGHLFRPRLDPVVQVAGGPVGAAVAAAMGILMWPLAVVPGGAVGPGLAVLLIGLALTTRDGLALAIALLVAALSLGGAVWLVA
jgi:hypothetical protein